MILAANDRGYRCVVIGDACASDIPELHEMCLKVIAAQGGILRLGLELGHGRGCDFDRERSRGPPQTAIRP